MWPENTVVLTKQILPKVESTWSVDCPIYKINIGNPLVQTGMKFLGKKLGQRWGLLKDEKGVRNFLIEQKVDVFLGEFIDSSWPMMRLVRDLGIPFFVHAHGIDLSARYRDPVWKKRYAEYDLADGVIVVNGAMRKRLVSLGVTPSKIHLIPYGVDVPVQSVIRTEDHVVRCFAVGRMVAKKAPLLLLDAFRLALLKQPNLHLDFVGEGEQFSDVLLFITKHGLEEKVTLHGGQGHQVVLELMQKSDIFVQHSITDVMTGDEEGLPVAILEAMSFALPVVSTKHAGIPDAVYDGVNGYLVDEGDVQGMAKHIVSLATDADLRKRLGTAGWQRARDQFSWEVERTSLCQILGLK